MRTFYHRAHHLKCPDDMTEPRTRHFRTQNMTLPNLEPDITEAHMIELRSALPEGLIPLIPWAVLNTQENITYLQGVESVGRVNIPTTSASHIWQD